MKLHQQRSLQFVRFVQLLVLVFLQALALAPGALAPYRVVDLTDGRADLAAFVLAGLVCFLVFALYIQPDMMVTLAEQLWACL